MNLTPSNSEGSSTFDGVLKVFSKALPSEFAFLFAAIKTLVLSDRLAVILGCIAALGLFFYAPKVDVTGILKRLLMVVSGVAFVLLLEVDAAAEIFQYCLHTIESMTSSVRFFCAFVLILNVFSIKAESSNKSITKPPTDGDFKDVNSAVPQH